MVDLVAAVREALSLLFTRAPTRVRSHFSLFGRPAATDLELEAWAERTFAEFKGRPLVEPSRDLVAAVRQRLERVAAGDRPDGSEPEPRPGH